MIALGLVASMIQTLADLKRRNVFIAKEGPHNEGLQEKRKIK